jgi:hypothetical protein
MAKSAYAAFSRKYPMSMPVDNGQRALTLNSV